jgi:hypothetical protein
VVGQSLQVLAVGVNDTLGSLSGAVVQDHVRGMGQEITGTLDNTFHGKSSSLIKILIGIPCGILFL